MNSTIDNTTSQIIKIDGNYKCTHCNKIFNSIVEIEKHIKLYCKLDLRYNNFYVIDKKKTGRYLFNDQKAGDIYIIQTDFSIDDSFKIGITGDLYNRLCQYRTGCIYEPRLLCYYPCKDISKCDTIMKKELRKFNIKREIYKGNLNAIKDTIINVLRNINKITYECIPDVTIGDICECENCNEVFIHKSDLEKHINNVHQKPTNYINNSHHNLNKQNFMKYHCAMCNYETNNKSNYNRHTKLPIHSKINTDFVTNEPNELVMNIYDNNVCKNSKHVCKNCNATFTQLSNYSRHINYRCPKNKEFKKTELTKNKENAELKQQLLEYQYQMKLKEEEFKLKELEIENKLIKQYIIETRQFIDYNKHKK
ncbi:hypothetical protein QKU48_gp1160 [Fadolivirus algeromassiliense]|jgi:transposase-like protein|uniref:C2H2-type domain-containing protein n=1 Tax=Fadolivirus FV1/VV64 TaxID=3070911 RepID=A0A7D3R2M6_9VIRU|nr:hypothetical protein QKU48_gp1160 [Fadolivirus algeromassiliense]QKF94618.1 hypothetical protein Fadolivirus_1_1160 [Fadolivirus FV1/VV64]